MKRKENREKRNPCPAENLHALELLQFLRRKRMYPALVPEQRQKRTRYGYRNPSECPVRRLFLIADNLFRLKKGRLLCAQRRYAIRFGKSGTEFTVNVKYQTIPGGKR